MSYYYIALYYISLDNIIFGYITLHHIIILYYVTDKHRIRHTMRPTICALVLLLACGAALGMSRTRCDYIMKRMMLMGRDRMSCKH